MTNDNILATVKLTLAAEGLNYKKASDFQGVLYTRVVPEYVDFLHNQQLHPYSQYIYFEDGEPYWYINVMSLDAYENIIKPVMEPTFTSFKINNGNINVKIVKKELISKGYSELMEDFYEKPADKDITINIRTYTAFKQNGRYNIIPDLRLIFQSLMMKYSAISSNNDMIDEDTLEQLVTNSSISKYKLRTGIFPEEGRTIPGFMGTFTIRFFGTETMARYARMLFEFGEFSGIGIKTGMGMGAIKINKEESSDR